MIVKDDLEQQARCELSSYRGVSLLRIVLCFQFVGTRDQGLAGHQEDGSQPLATEGSLFLIPEDIIWLTTDANGDGGCRIWVHMYLSNQGESGCGLGPQMYLCLQKMGFECTMLTTQNTNTHTETQSHQCFDVPILPYFRSLTWLHRWWRMYATSCQPGSWPGILDSLTPCYGRMLWEGEVQCMCSVFCIKSKKHQYKEKCS